MIINVRLWELLGLLEESTRSEWINQSARYFQIGYENWGLHVRTISVYVHHACASFIFPCSNRLILHTPHCWFLKQQVLISRSLFRLFASFNGVGLATFTFQSFARFYDVGIRLYTVYS